MTPPFDIEGGLPLALARGVSVIGLVAAFGGVFYARVLAPPHLPPGLQDQLRRVGLAGLAASLAGGLLWLLAQSHDMADSTAPGAVWAVLCGTQFGHLLAARMVLLLMALTAWWRGWETAAVAASGVALLLQAGHSHAEAMYGPSLLLGSAGLHVLAAGVWLGGLVPLWVVVSRAPINVAWQAARRFSPAGIACVGVLLATAGYQGWVLLGGFVGVLGTAYGWVVLAKIAMFGVLGILAARNRFRHTPGLQGASAGIARRSLGRNVALETAAGVAILLAAGVLTELPPAMHAQIVWPLPYRISLEAVSEDAGLRAEAMQGAVLVGLAVLAILALAASAMWRRHSLAGRAVHGSAALVALGVIAVAAPHLDMLFVPAWPTQYYVSPTHFSAASIVRGAALYGPNCAACHGAEGRGDGPAAKGLVEPPANLTAAHLWMHPDGELFWWLAHGIRAPDGSLAMPGFETILSDDDRWNLIDMIRARNAGLSVANGKWQRIIAAPSFGMLCEGGQTRELRDFSGQVVRLVVGGPAQAVAGMVSITTDAGARPAAGICVAQDDAVGPAYMLAAGLQGRAEGTEFLIDPQGLLRQAWPAGSAPSAQALAEAASAIAATKAVPAALAGAGMNMDDMNMGGMNMGGMKMDGMKM